MTPPVAEPVMVGVAQASPARAVAWSLGLIAAAGLVAGLTAAVFRWYARERLPTPLATLAALTVVAVDLNTTGALGTITGESGGLLDVPVVLVNVATFAGAAVAAGVAVRAGDHLAVAVAGRRPGDADVGALVRSVGRVIAVELPATVEDVEGYDPVRPETKAALAGRRLAFPRGLTVAALRDRLVTRLKEDFEVGHVDVDLAPDGTVEHLAVGSRAAGLGPTLPPGTVAVAVHADPAFGASPGDRVQIVAPGDPPSRVATGELRAAVGDVVTLAVERSDAEALDDATRYRLATLPEARRPAEEFAGVLRAADETMEVVRVAADGPLAGTPVGALAATVVAVRPADGRLETLPGRDRVLEPGDAVYAVGRPEALRRLVAGEPGGAGA